MTVKLLMSNLFAKSNINAIISLSSELGIVVSSWFPNST